MQWRMLRRRGPQASWTIVGDPAQSSFPDPKQTADAVDSLIGHAPSRRFRLATNYRSPAEVFALAGAYITRYEPDADLPTAIRETGIAPSLRVVPSGSLAEALRGVVDELLPQTEGTLGIIVPAGRFAEISGLDWPGQVSVVTALDAKGMEYDDVVVVAPDEIVATTAGGPRVLYVALTRPTQRLVTLDLDRPGEWRESL